MSTAGAVLDRFKLMVPAGSLTRGDKIFLTSLALLIMALIVAVALFFRREYVPPVRFSAEVYEPVNPLLCPGDALEFTTEVTVQKDSDIMTLRSIRQPIVELEVGRGYRTVAFINTTYASVDEGDNIRTERDVEVPALPAGNYDLVVSVTPLSGEAVPPARYRVPFTVAEGCPITPPETSFLW